MGQFVPWTYGTDYNSIKNRRRMALEELLAAAVVAGRDDERIRTVTLLR
jgi:hypothetical protein